MNHCVNVKGIKSKILMKMIDNDALNKAKMVHILTGLYNILHILISEVKLLFSCRKLNYFLTKWAFEI